MSEKLERHIRVEKGLTQDIKISCPPEQSEIVSKINELVDAVNELQTMFKSCDNQIGILAEQIAKLQHDNSGKANCQENVLTKSLRMDKEFAEDECVRLQKELNYTQKALDVAVDALNTIKGKHDPRCAVYHIDEKKPLMMP